MDAALSINRNRFMYQR